MVCSAIAHFMQVSDLLSVHLVLVFQICHSEVPRQHVGRDWVNTVHHCGIHHARHHGRLHAEASHAVSQGGVEVVGHVATHFALEGLESLADALQGAFIKLLIVALGLA